ncbi:hypothetical protein RISW2_03120, partial [Roseivivax isoporae LMG 25204]
AQALLSLIQGYVDGVLSGRFPAGTAGAPAIAGAGDPDTGLSFPGGNQLRFSAGGAQRALLSAAALQVDVPLTGSAVQSSILDATSGRALLTRAFGLGGQVAVISGSTPLNQRNLETGFYTFVGSATPGGPDTQAFRYTLIVMRGFDDRRQFICMRDASSPTSARIWVGHQTGNDATGPINWYDIGVERGSNSNGEYIRFSDGTQFCTQFLLASASGSTPWTFPAAFVEVDSASVTPQSGSPRSGVIDGIGLTSLSFSTYDQSGNRQGSTGRLMAIGRYF